MVMESLILEVLLSLLDHFLTSKLVYIGDAGVVKYSGCALMMADMLS